MSDRSLILQISNHHAAGCGTPPRVEERSGQYLGYLRISNTSTRRHRSHRRRGSS